MDSLERLLKEILPFKHYIFCGYARNCLYLLLKSLDLKYDDEIILPAFTSSSIYEVVRLAGVKIKYVDCEEDTLNICPDRLLETITNKTRIIYVVHTYGTSASIERIVDIARKNGILVIEDIVHSIYREYRHKKLGTFGDYTLLSFTKSFINFQGACLATNDKSIFAKMLYLQSKYKKSINHFKYIPLYIYRFLGSIWEVKGSLLPMLVFKSLLKIRTIFRITYNPDSFSNDFFHMTGLSASLTCRELKNEANHLQEKQYEKFCMMYSEFITTPGLLDEQTGIRPKQLIGIIHRKNFLLELFSIEAWRNPHKPGVFKRADKLYSECRIFSNVILKGAFRYAFNKNR